VPVDVYGFESAMLSGIIEEVYFWTGRVFLQAAQIYEICRAQALRRFDL
jgi:hypothetical protein